MGIQIKPQNPTHNQSNFKINLNAQLKSRLGKKKKKKKRILRPRSNWKEIALLNISIDMPC